MLKLRFFLNYNGRNFYTPPVSFPDIGTVRYLRITSTTSSSSFNVLQGRRTLQFLMESPGTATWRHDQISFSLSQFMGEGVHTDG